MPAGMTPWRDRAPSCDLLYTLLPRPRIGGDGGARGGAVGTYAGDPTAGHPSVGPPPHRRGPGYWLLAAAILLLAVCLILGGFVVVFGGGFAALFSR